MSNNNNKLDVYREDSDESEDDWVDEDEEEVDLSAKLTLSITKQVQHEHDQEWVRDIDEKTIQQEKEQKHRERQLRVKVEPFLKQLDALKELIDEEALDSIQTLNIMEMCKGIMQASREPKLMVDVIASRVAGHINHLLDLICNEESGISAVNNSALIHLLRACTKASEECQEAMIYYGIFPKVYKLLRNNDNNSEAVMALVHDFCLRNETGLKLFIATDGVSRVLLPLIEKPQFTDACIQIILQIQCMKRSALISNLLNHNSALVDTLTKLLIDLAKLQGSENRRRVEMIIQININLNPTTNPDLIQQLLQMIQDPESFQEAMIQRSVFTYVQSMMFNTTTAIAMVAQGLVHMMVENGIYSSPLLDHVISVVYSLTEKAEKMGKSFRSVHEALKNDCKLIMENTQKSVVKQHANAIYLSLAE